MKARILGLAVAAWLLALPAWAQSDAALVKRTTELRDGPGDQNKSLGTLEAQAPITRLSQRQGPWVQVRSAQGTVGWLHMFDVTTPAAQAAASTGGGPLRGLSSLFGGGSAKPATTATSTVGIRGLDAEDIANATPDLNAVTKAETLRVDANQARRFAGGAQLAARSVDDLPAPSTGFGGSASPGQNAATPTLDGGR